ncbi:MAG: type IX secretion system membrane protein PorP/SprF [Cytophagaceae bacterium]|nr:type IX secretion system membrane protein PorP/SprF [Cytophagaceae bacterium]MDW8455636.1 type IX secretion system membrane protein PorP/SprF [Cytophagaceae bacterium]
MTKIFLLIALIRTFLMSCAAQQHALYTQYMFNSLPINPAYAGSHERPSLTLLAKKQWLNINGSPATQTFSVHSPIRKNKMALGFTAVNDYLGVTHQTGCWGTYAYRITGKKYTLSLGLQAGFTNYISKFSTLSVRTPNDPAFASDDVRYFLPNFGTGAYYYSDKFYLSASVPHILDHLGRQTNVAANAVQYQHFFLSSGYVFTLSESLKYKPEILVRIIKGAPLGADFNSTLIIEDVLWAGISYRTATSVNFIVRAMLTDQFSLGYAYDTAINPLSKVTVGSHEIMLNYRFVYFKKNVDAPKYF